MKGITKKFLYMIPRLAILPGKSKILENIESTRNRVEKGQGGGHVSSLDCGRGYEWYILVETYGDVH